MKSIFLFSVILILSSACQNTQKEEPKTTYEKDLDFMSKYHEVLELSSSDNGHAKIMVIPDYQGRVMTSTSTGKSHGWLNYELIESGEVLSHMNAFGGEERLWLSPEGGQFSVFFEKGKDFEFENWQTPAAIDSEPFELVSKTSSEAAFKKRIKLKNYLNTAFDIEIIRIVKALSTLNAEENLNLVIPETLKMVAYKSENTLTNLGKGWQKETGTLGLWILGMYTPSENTTLLAPFFPNVDLALTDNYFGEMPAARLVHTDSVLLFKGDGNYRSKIGLAPPSSKSVAGAWDAINEVLTIIQFDLSPNADYLKSTWELHENPYSGDAFNSYNDGPTEDGTQMGPFIELESNSSTRALRNGESLVHRQATYHFEGDRTELNIVALLVLGIDLETIEKRMN